MRVRVIYRIEPDGTWATSPDVPGYSAVGEDVDEVRELVRDGLPIFLGRDVEIEESGIDMLADLAQPLNVQLSGHSATFDPPKTGTLCTVD